MTTFIDTGAWYAVADGSDRHHHQASRFFLDHAAQAVFITSELVVGETLSLLVSHLGRHAALSFWAGLREARIPILTPDAVDLEAAWRIAQTFPDQSFSFVDCTSFAMMERLGLLEAFTFDVHFLVYRFGPTRQRAFRVVPS